MSVLFDIFFGSYNNKKLSRNPELGHIDPYASLRRATDFFHCVNAHAHPDNGCEDQSQDLQSPFVLAGDSFAIACLEEIAT